MNFYEPFDGDGRTMVRPTASTKNGRPGTSPAPLTRAQARRVIDLFAKHGHTSHGKTGSDLWVLDTWAHHQGLPVRIMKHPLGGWHCIEIEDEKIQA